MQKVKETVKELETELRSAQEEIKEYQEFRLRDREDNKRLKEFKRHLELRCRDIYCGLMAERADLEGRMWRIDQRIRACGYKAPPDVTAERAAKESPNA